MTTKLNIFTWNILAKPLFNPKIFKQHAVGIFDVARRDQVIEEKIKQLCLSGSIIALQEVDGETYSNLVMILSTANYEFHWLSNGNHLNDYMGILVSLAQVLQTEAI